MTNPTRGTHVEVACICRGFVRGCPLCDGEGLVRKRSCRRCGGTGKDGSRCPDCRGQGWRELDQPSVGDLWP